MLVSSVVLHQLLLRTLTEIHYKVNEAAQLTTQCCVIVHRCHPHFSASVFLCTIWTGCGDRRKVRFWPLGNVFQVPNSALSLWKAPPAPALSALRQPLHHRGGVLQEDYRQRPHHQAPVGHVQVQRHMNPCHLSRMRLGLKGRRLIPLVDRLSNHSGCKLNIEHKIFLTVLHFGSAGRKTANPHRVAR